MKKVKEYHPDKDTIHVLVVDEKPRMGSMQSARMKKNALTSF
jgi:hypothetical protein